MIFRYKKYFNMWIKLREIVNKKYIKSKYDDETYRILFDLINKIEKEENKKS